MNYKVLYRRYRPATFEEVSGQKYVCETLKNAVINNKISHAYIFTGPRGTGKTTMAKIFARSINCQHPINGNPCMECESCKNFKDNPDIIEIDAASNNGVDEIRELINNIKLAPSNSKFKVYIIDEVHMLSTSAFNALLLTLEEPPSHVVFILATTDIQNVPITILSRTQRFDFTRISMSDLCSRLKYVCENENISITEDAIKEIAQLSDGGLRDALSILDQLSAQRNNIDLDSVQKTFGDIPTAKIQKLINLLEENDINGLNQMLDEFKNSSIDCKVLINKLIIHLKNRAIDIKLGNINENRLSFDDVKNLILDLVNNVFINVSIDPYIIVQMILLEYMGKKAQKNYFPGNKEEKVISQEIKTEKDESVSIQNADNEIQKVKKIRVNNCFVGANKNDLAKVKSFYQHFINSCNISDKNLYMLLCDTSVVAASDKYFIIQALSISTAGLINNQLSKIEKLILQEENVNYKFIALSKEEWQFAKNEYIHNKNNNINYEYKDEIVLEEKQEENIDSIVNDVFNNIKVEME